MIARIALISSCLNLARSSIVRVSQRILDYLSYTREGRKQVEREEQTSLMETDLSTQILVSNIISESIICEKTPLGRKLSDEEVRSLLDWCIACKQAVADLQM